MHTTSYQTANLPYPCRVDPFAGHPYLSLGPSHCPPRPLEACTLTLDDHEQVEVVPRPRPGPPVPSGAGMGLPCPPDSGPSRSNIDAGSRRQRHLQQGPGASPQWILAHPVCWSCSLCAAFLLQPPCPYAHPQHPSSWRSSSKPASWLGLAILESSLPSMGCIHGSTPAKS